MGVFKMIYHIKGRDFTFEELEVLVHSMSTLHLMYQKMSHRDLEHIMDRIKHIIAVTPKHSHRF